MTQQASKTESTAEQKAFLDNLGFSICLQDCTNDAKVVAAFEKVYKAKLRDETPLVRLAGDEGPLSTPQGRFQAMTNAWLLFVREEVWNKVAAEERDRIAIEALAQHLAQAT